MNRLKWIELVLIIVMVSTAALLAMPQLERTQEARHQSACVNNLKQIGLFCKMFANEWGGGMYPPLSPVRDNWMMDVEALYPEYVSDLGVFICPGHPRSDPNAFALTGNAGHPNAKVGEAHPACVSSQFYVYTGFLIGDDMDAITVFDTALGEDWEAFRHNDLRPQLPYALDAFTRGGGGVVMWDRVPGDLREMAHGQHRLNALFMDGHVESLPYSHENPGHDFPATRVSGQTFGSVLPKLSPDCVGLPTTNLSLAQVNS